MAIQFNLNALSRFSNVNFGNVHPKQLSSVYYALSQSDVCGNINGGFLSHGISSNEHMAVTLTL